MQRLLTLTSSRWQRRHGVAVLALLGVLWTQVGAAAHQFDHLATDLGDTCEICVQFERNDDAVVTDAVIDTADARPVVARGAIVPLLRSAGSFDYRQRGPPTT